MEITRMEIADVDLAVALLPHLRGRVFHVTNQTSFKEIHRCGAILNNRDERFALNVASGKSFGRQRGWVCLFDLRECTNKTIKETLDKYYFLEPSWFMRYTPDYTISELTYLFLKSKAYPELVSCDVAKKEWLENGRYGHYVPNTEAWYLGDIPLSLVESVLLVTIRTEAPKNDPFLYAHHQLNYERQQSGSDG